MIIVIDFDQTYTADPDLWNRFIDIAEDNGHDVICVTCRAFWDTTNMHPIIEKLGADNVYFTDNEAKIPYMEGRCHVDIFIDDTPATVTGGGSVMYKSQD